jgi:hypothetical protein
MDCEAFDFLHLEVVLGFFNRWFGVAGGDSLIRVDHEHGYQWFELLPVHP